MQKKNVKDKIGKPIHEQDYVFTRYRGGTHEGRVEKIVMSREEAEDEGVSNPPKVVYTDQHGHPVAHNPQTLIKDDE
ncbi:hypothetical protein BGW36DRAFT_433110 [Talaromyces proteolyticus]|uniref:Hypervirulence associated protein TUDOR domain-containing protein n=1 Tax=Talaromyces proteolyticus TaxID=1131652 RepID=A0AAD4KFZ5_9EURO|nr:uncharacterized protein BGW36DRAFT_433110 [Talaromyces proteolyticus]KAH8690156.1 hypothetical protein BGW36DRAFT_433110 [Talaromyces proteolyticus]